MQTLEAEAALDPILGRSYPPVASSIHVAVERLYRLLRDDLAAFLKDHGKLRLQDWRILTVLHEAGELSQKTIVDMVLMEQAQVSRALADLCKNNLLLKRRSLSDRRVSRYRLSAEGRRFYEALLPAAMARRQRLDSILSTAEAAEFLACARKIGTHVLGGSDTGS